MGKSKLPPVFLQGIYRYTTVAAGLAGTKSIALSE